MEKWVAERKAMIDRSHDLPVATQAKELGISRDSVYYLPRPVSGADLALMRRIDELHLEYPFAGSRVLRDLLAGEGMAVGRLHVATLMKKMAIQASAVITSVAGRARMTACNTVFVNDRDRSLRENLPGRLGSVGIHIDRRL